MEKCVDMIRFATSARTGPWTLAQNIDTPGATNPTELAWLPVIILLAAIAIAVAVVWWRRRRRWNLQQLASRLGFERVEYEDDAAALEHLEKLIGGSLLFRSGYFTELNVWVRGEIDGTEVHVVDYGEYPLPGRPRDPKDESAYTGRRGFGDRTQTLVFFREEGLDLPRFLLVPNNVYMRAAASNQDVVTWGNEAFGKRNRVMTREEARVRRLFDRDLQKMLIDNRNLSIETFDEVLLVCRYADAPSAFTVEQLVNTGRDLLRQMKANAPAA
jgi:hypothetical protein